MGRPRTRHDAAFRTFSVAAPKPPIAEGKSGHADYDQVYGQDSDRFANMRGVSMRRSRYAMESRRIAVSLSIALAAGLLPSAASGFQQMQPTGKLLPTGAAASDLERISNGFAEIAERVKPSVVSIKSMAINEEMNAELRRMFGDRDFQPIPVSGTGSGVIFDPAGYIVTNNHVVEDADVVRVTLADGRELEAEVVGTDSMTDLAVIRIDGNNLTACHFGDSDAVRVGNLVLAIGSPFKFGHSVSHGIISAVGRSNVDVEIDYKNWIQTDAAINPGNSGGPLINTRGEIIGISVAIATESGGYQGVGFAIPSNTVARVTETLKRGEKVVRGYLGVIIKAVNTTIAEGYGLNEAKGAMLQTIGPDTPAEKAGLQAEDIILAIDGREIKGLEELQERVAHMTPGTRSMFRVWRKRAVREIPVEIGRQPEHFRTQGTQEDLSPRGKESPRDMQPTDRTTRAQPSKSAAEPGSEYFPRFGMHVADLTSDLRDKYNVAAGITSGVLVTGVDPLGEAFNAELRRRCVIRRVNDEEVKNLADFKRLLEKHKASRGLRLAVQIGEDTYHTVIRNYE